MSACKKGGSGCRKCYDVIGRKVWYGWVRKAEREG